MYKKFEKVIRTEELVNLELIVNDISGISNLEDVIEEAKQQLARLEGRFNLEDFIDLKTSVYSDIAERFKNTSEEEANVSIVDLSLANEKFFLEAVLPDLLKSINKKLTNGVERVFINAKSGVEPIEIKTSEEAEDKLKELYYNNNF